MLFPLLAYCFLLLSLAGLLSCSENRREVLRRRILDAPPIPYFKSLPTDLPETAQKLSVEFKRLIVETFEETERFVQLFKQNPAMAFKLSRRNDEKGYFGNFLQFYVALRFLQSTLQTTINTYFPISEKTLVGDQMSQVFPSIRLLRHILKEQLIFCASSMPRESFNYQLDVLLSLPSIVTETQPLMEFEIFMKLNDSTISWIRRNADNLVHRLTRLHLILLLHHSEIIQQSQINHGLSSSLDGQCIISDDDEYYFREMQHHAIEEIQMRNTSVITGVALSYYFLSSYVIHASIDDVKNFFSSDPAVALGTVDAFVQDLEELPGHLFFSGIWSQKFLISLMKTKNIPDNFLKSAKARLRELQEIEKNDRLILLADHLKDEEEILIVRKVSSRKKPSKNHPKRRNTVAKTKLTKPVAEKKTRKILKDKSDKEEIIIDKPDTFTITLPIDVHHIRLGQYCYDNALFEVLKRIPNNKNYTWSMVAEYCTTAAGQEILYHLNLTKRDISSCIQIVRDRGLMAHPNNVSIEQVKQDISVLLSVHRNFKPLRHLLEFANGQTEWKLIPGRHIPSVIENAEEEVLVAVDVLMMAFIRVGSFCWDEIFVPAATAMNIDPMYASMRDIMEAAFTKTIPFSADILKDCKAIYDLRNKYTHRVVTKEQAIASQREAYEARFENLSILRQDFQCKTSQEYFW